MIDVATTWQQACTALAGDDYDTAFSVLTGAMHEAAKPTRARLALYLASVHALYGDAALAEVGAALQQARTLDPALRGDPLYLALNAELGARTLGAEAAPPAPEVRAAADPLARYHALAALSLAEQPQGALDLELALSELPRHLGWRLRSWQADAEEQLGHTEQAAHLYAEAAHHAQGLNRAVMLQEGAALQLQLGDPAAAATLLEQARALYTGRDPEEEGLNLATWHYLQAQALLNLGKPEEALSAVREADRLERTHGDPSYGVALVWGQVLTHLGQHEEALRHFERALALAQGPDRPYAQHELGVALLDLDRPVEARERLEAVLSDPEYPYAPEVLADLAECDYRLGRLQEAQTAAEQALAQGAVIPASLVLGSVALEYYHLDEALEHYERVIREAAPESRDWVTGHQMAADVMAQQGFLNPAAAYAHAQQALAHTPESDDWHSTLRDHLTKAETLMGQGGGRMLN
ncbi:tetratricopeptide repeat protein [Deinococcus budaensis]|uniref:Tetratricopeptide (TPR) repeat protein n=1 Tax=Deinococcus budaensis TaxID=1665626 RepID=A0A7W8GFS1_9DEIO|nr:tetratricopeptide repeat protein [Deinococcus budaensis]MBB5234524.1 tetratricopeptide (TPR) repeat protein [Deinococcus budaensis]